MEDKKENHEEHSHACGCGCGHHHHDEHEHSCGCGCDHHHHDEHVSAHTHENDTELALYEKDRADVMKSESEIELDERRALGHIHHEETEDSCEVCGKDLSHCKCLFLEEGYLHIHFRLSHLNCRDCAAKLEGKIREMPAVYFASVSFIAKELRIISKEDPNILLPAILETAHHIDGDIGLLPDETDKTYQTETYSMPSLDCAACAAKLERLINEYPGVLSATVSYATKQLKLTAENPDTLIPDLIRACNTVENGTVIEKVSASKRKQASEEETMSASEKAAYVLAFLAFILGMLTEHASGLVPTLFSWQTEICFGISYMIFGGEILLKAGKNILHGEIFDENFLMSVATLGAIGIGEMSEAVGVMMFYRIGEYMEDRASDRSRDKIMEAVDLRPETVHRICGAETETIPAEEAKIGDVLLIRPGDRIPLDGIIIEGNSHIDTSPITGEPQPVTVGVGDSVNSGCVNENGLLKLRVEKPLSESMVSRILDSVENAVAGKPKMDRFITRFSRIYTPIVVLCALLVAVLPPLLTDDAWQPWIYTALTFLVISCPCALVISVPLSFFAGIGAGSEKGILFKSGTSIESAAHTKVAVMDKTGTLTEGKFTVREVRPIADVTEDEILAFAAAAETFSTHPIAKSVSEAASEKHLALPPMTDVKETAGKGIVGNSDGAVISLGNARLMKDFGIVVEESEYSVGTEIWLAMDSILLGSLIISDGVKPDAERAVSSLKEMGILPVMLTGDERKNANAVGRELGIYDIYAGLLPDEKLSKMKEFREKHGAVLFVGDGINDAPVLAGADTGAAMGSGADAAIEAADIVFLHTDVMSIPQSVKIAKTVLSVAGQNVVFALAVKIAVMLMGLGGFANLWIAVFADVGVTILCILNSVRLLYKKM